MHYKLVVTDEMDRLLDERVGYLIKEFKSNQAASHLLDGIEEIYDYLETNPEIYRESQDAFMRAFHYREAKVNGMDYILVYKILDDTVYILGLFHSLENYSGKMQLIWGDNWS